MEEANYFRGDEDMSSKEGEEKLDNAVLSEDASLDDVLFVPISEAAEKLKVPPHVLRFWEVKFPDITPVKRRGGRRFYRCDDIKLLEEIRDLLYKEGYTIKGVQKLLEDAGRKKKHKDTSALKPQSSVIVCNRNEIKSVCNDLRDVVEAIKRIT